MPLAATVKLTGLNAATVCETGCVVIVGTGGASVTVKSSIASAESAPVSSLSVQRRTSVWPGAQVRPVSVAVIFGTRLAVRLPSSFVVAPVAIGAVKSSAVAAVNVPVLRSAAPTA